MDCSRTHFTKAAGSGDQLAALVALRDVLAQHIEVCESSRDLASLSRQFTQVIAEIETVTKGRAPTARNPLDELRARRAVPVQARTADDS